MEAGRPTAFADGSAALNTLMTKTTSGPLTRLGCGFESPRIPPQRSWNGFSRTRGNTSHNKRQLLWNVQRRFAAQGCRGHLETLAAPAAQLTWTSWGNPISAVGVGVLRRGDLVLADARFCPLDTCHLPASVSFLRNRLLIHPLQFSAPSSPLTALYPYLFQGNVP
ncbi:ankyrin repeat domain-containing protein 37 isoform X1 [Nomascus leucogenys]|uniref:ankyrin repeat domain-containing protein 37 isoform X1 n=1 Tax=Nomascus leucogenys TaxID=61853 RepID=UPI00122DA643|nr:ankyrin repeat domain-containing protein 37 isoform X1 [Nomascus leucogenys]XP_030672255.1 ankyrin repeat domain-containing protein 37 isoform X1 [Nomascus leucogenys]XP_030672256.1 ankyrin repeat domain-containing protein 37 isoform X1 [Nomascus leucogenys]